jgi:hypothetical protein
LPGDPTLDPLSNQRYAGYTQQPAPFFGVGPTLEVIRRWTNIEPTLYPILQQPTSLPVFEPGFAQ